MFPALEFFEWAHMWIAVVQVSDQAYVQLVVLGVVHERPSAGITFTQRPAKAMNNESFFMILRGNFPYFFNADAIVLRVLAII